MMNNFPRKYTLSHSRREKQSRKHKSSKIFNNNFKLFCLFIRAGPGRGGNYYNKINSNTDHIINQFAFTHESLGKAMVNVSE